MVKIDEPYSDGNITVEAVFIMPIVIFILLAVVLFGFYMQERAALSEIAGEGALAGAWLYRWDGRPNTGELDFTIKRPVFFSLTGPFTVIEDKVREYVSERLNRPFRLIQKTEAFVKADRKGVHVVITSEASIPVPGARLYFGAVRKIKQTADGTAFCPAEFVRRCTAAEAWTENRR